ncbi:hypothetical protein [Mesorhizobium sp. M0037]|uniref:hypothetical protein n=1 Tax=unclassified Mesorhizobium TaxID=325217 RepID=UPI00333AB86A
MAKLIFKSGARAHLRRALLEDGPVTKANVEGVLDLVASCPQLFAKDASNFEENDDDADEFLRLSRSPSHEDREDFLDRFKELARSIEQLGRDIRRLK